MDVFPTYWQHLTRIVGWDDDGISGGRGGYGKIGKCSDITYFTYFSSMDHVTHLFIWTILKFPVISVENALSEDGTTNYHIGLKWHHIVRILPTYKMRNIICVTDVRNDGIKRVTEKCVPRNCVTAGHTHLKNGLCKSFRHLSLS